MPNQRAKNKTYVSAHVTKETRKAFDAMWKRRGYPSRTAALDRLMTIVIDNPSAIDALLRLAKAS